MRHLLVLRVFQIHNQLAAVAKKTENPGKTPASGGISVRVPEVFEKTGWKNREERDSACLDRLRRETGGTIALVIFVISCTSILLYTRTVSL